MPKGDRHFMTVYLFCRLCGINTEYSKIIAGAGSGYNIAIRQHFCRMCITARIGKKYCFLICDTYQGYADTGGAGEYIFAVIFPFGVTGAAEPFYMFGLYVGKL